MRYFICSLVAQLGQNLLYAEFEIVYIPLLARNTKLSVLDWIDCEIVGVKDFIKALVWLGFLLPCFTSRNVY